jgi:hypothetical protein
MCANCGYPAAPGHWTDAGTADAGERMRARFRRARVLNAILRPYGLTAHDGGVIPGVQIATLSGSHEIARDLTEVWVAAERLAGAPVDPLDPRFVSAGGETT